MNHSLLFRFAMMTILLTAGLLYCPPASAEPNNANAETLDLYVGQSMPIKTDFRLARASVTNPEVADIQTLSPDEVLVVAKAVGATDVILWGEEGQMRRHKVEVGIDLGRLQSMLGELFPDSSLQLRHNQGVYFVSGRLNRAEHVDMLHKFMEAAELNYVDMTEVPGVQQVQLQVRVAEVSRSAIRAMGFNALKGGNDFFGGLTVGSSSGGALNPFSIGPPEDALAFNNVPFVFPNDVQVAPLVTLFGGFPGSDFEFFLQALAENQYLRILAEPNLVALSGEEARFHAGGEFPIPVVQGTSTGGISISIEYRKFGVLLGFIPTVLGDNQIRLRVITEVSDLTNVGAVEIQGFRVPSIVTRQAETTIDLNSGQTFAMAGLLNETNDARNSRIPVLGELPVIGTLFRSIRYEKGETELAILVTSDLVEPLELVEHPALPGDAHVVPNDWEFFVNGMIEGAAGHTPPDRRQNRMADHGWADLAGPGAWADYEDGISRSQADPHRMQMAAMPTESESGTE